MAEASFVVVSAIFRAITVAYVLYLGVGSGTVAPGVLVCNIALDTLIWRIGTWCLVAVAWSNIVWVVVMDVCILGLGYRGIRARNFEPRVLGRNILLATSIWRTGPWFLVEAAWSHSMWVVVIDVGMSGMMLVRVG